MKDAPFAGHGAVRGRPWPSRTSATARVPGTCGELVQGVLDGNHFHVTCPIDLYSTATVDVTPGSGTVRGLEGSWKARRAMELTLETLGRADVEVHATINNPLPHGKGMASSTADVVAVIMATGAALGSPLDAQEVAAIAVRIEPSDGVMFPGIALFDHRSGSIGKTLGTTPAMRILVLDFGGTVDTFAFNQDDHAATLSHLDGRWREALRLVTEGVRTGDARLLGQGATLGVEAHQDAVPRPHVVDVLSFARSVGALGVNAAYSGTVVGVLFEDRLAQVNRAAARAEGLPGLHRVSAHRLVGGGGTVTVGDGAPPFEKDGRPDRRTASGTDREFSR